jgi:prepilin-type N-terminal cleavage/methylation domain-containing protein
MTKKQQSGFTLIEIAIVLVIIGLLLGGVLKGQELIQSARVRNLVAQQDGIKAAYFGFLDRYRALPGDYSQATTNISNMTTAAACGAGNGNGDGSIVAGTNNAEPILVWEHLARSGFINGTYTCAGTPSNATSPANPYSGLLDLRFDAMYDGTASNKHNLKTGPQVPSDILAEVDRKVDDGDPNTGTFRATGFFETTPAAAPPATCAAAAWLVASPAANCAGTSLF